MNKTSESLNIVPHLVKSQEELTKLIQEFIEETDVQFDYPKLLQKYQLEDYHWGGSCVKK